MSKLTEIGIYNKFREVIPVKANWFNYHENFNSIQLDGTFSSDELREIARVMDEIVHGTPEERKIKRIQNINVNGFTYKDIKIIYYLVHEDSETFSYSFFITKDGKDYDFDYGSTLSETQNWWPKGELKLFVPEGFTERCENCYRYDGTDAEAIELLKKCGFTVEPEKTT